ncbi:MAG: hypothetical protein NC417_00655 [Candidatus Gastranaerophilales bacterium]|nr:hypothetical protein [Candidatus Gastranaerophilales bacterium]
MGIWEGSYGKEPFDLRLTGLRMIRDSLKIAVAIILGTILFGGGYYVKNVLLYRDHVYAATSVYKVEYVIEPAQSGDYFINAMTWNTYVHSEEFYKAFCARLIETEYVRQLSSDWLMRNLEEQWEETVEVIMESDWHVPSTIVTTASPEWSMAIAEALEQTLTQEFVEGNPQVSKVTVIDPADAAPEVLPDVRPLRAVILSAVLSCFFVVMIWLLREISADGIWLPATLRRRYGLAALGTVGSIEFPANLEYRFAQARRIAVCAVEDNIDPTEVCQKIADCTEGGASEAKQWVPVPAPLLCAEGGKVMREMDGILLVVRAGNHVGKPLERVLEYLTEQELSVAGALLWEPDEWLLRSYYLMPWRRASEEEL